MTMGNLLTFRLFSDTELVSILRVIIATGIGFGATGCRPSPESEAGPDRVGQASHQRMVKELKVARDRAYRDTRYFGEHAELLEKRRRLNLINDSTPVVRQFEVYHDLALMELEQGRAELAIGYAKQAISIFKRPEIADSLLGRVQMVVALAYLRISEDQNCCANPGGEACLFPISRNAQHRKKEGARQALPYLFKVAGSPTAAPEDRFDAEWLISIAAMALGEYPEKVPELYRLHALPGGDVETEFPVFKNIAPLLGVDRFSMSGSVLVDDFTGDGKLEIINSTWDLDTGLNVHQLDAKGKYQQRLVGEKLSGISGGLNIRPADFDNDGDLDLLILRGAWLKSAGKIPNSLLRNDGVDANGEVKFTDVTFAAGLAEVSYPTGTAEWADFDLDGDLDLFIGNESLETDAPCQLFRNDGIAADGMPRFVDIAVAAGVDERSFVKGVSWGDFNNDRFPDLYLSCFGSENRLFQNRGNGTFTDVAAALNVAQPLACFPTWFWDYNNDGNLDLFVSSFVWHSGSYLLYYQGKPLDRRWLPRLYENDGDGAFVDVTKKAGLEIPMMPMGSSFGDLDNNGYADIYLGTGSPNFGGIVPNLLLMNEDGKTFIDRTTVSGMGHLQKGHGVSLTDYDGDGDLDVFEQMGGAYPSDQFYDAVFENPGFGNHWLEVRLKGTASNSYGVGCRVRAVITEGGAERSVYTWLNSGGSFGANRLVAHLGLGKAKKVDRLEVFWPVTGITQSFEKIDADQFIVVTEGEKKWRKR